MVTAPCISIQVLFIWQDKRPQKHNNKKIKECSVDVPVVSLFRIVWNCNPILSAFPIKKKKNMLLCRDQVELWDGSEFHQPYMSQVNRFSPCDVMSRQRTHKNHLQTLSSVCLSGRLSISGYWHTHTKKSPAKLLSRWDPSESQWTTGCKGFHAMLWPLSAFNVWSFHLSSTWTLRRFRVSSSLQHHHKIKDLGSHKKLQCFKKTLWLLNSLAQNLKSN